ncbi:MAG: VIT and vWA domain-containing protein [Gemmatimonadota bacterium]
MLNILRALFLLLAAGAVSAQPAGDATHTLSPYFVVTGALPGVDALPLKSTRADVTISGVIADVRVTQLYRNEGATPIEARYVFPASTRAAVYALRLRVGDRVVDAEVRERQQARRDYEKAKQQGRSAALLEQQRPNVFSMAVANVMPGDEIAVDLRYTETIVPDEGTYRFVFPTAVGPRYNGGTQPDGTPSESRKNEPWVAQPTLRAGQSAPHTFEMNATVLAPMPVKMLMSPSHAFDVDGVDEKRATARLEPDRGHANRDVVLEYRLAGAAIESGVLLQPGSDENFFLLLAEPPARVEANMLPPREYVFIVDISGSMHGFPLATAKSLLRELVQRLRPGDTFNVIPFAGGSSLLAPQSLPATGDNIAAALRFIDKQTGGGGTELLPALRRALALPSDPGRARMFAVITDGYVTIEKEAFELVRANLGAANVFAFGIGTSVNRFLIEGLARAGKGEPFFVLNAAGAEREAVRFRQVIEQPVLTHIRVKFPAGFDAYDLDVPQVPDLFAQRPVVLMGKYRGTPAGTIEVEGLAAGGAVKLPIDLGRTTRSDDTQALKYLWARSRIAELGDYQKLARDDDTRQAITALGLKYNLLTEYTSFIAIDKVVRNAGGASTSVDQPQPLPEGVSELALAAAPATPEPEFALLALLAGGLTWWLRRRRPATEIRHA